MKSMNELLTLEKDIESMKEFANKDASILTKIVLLNSDSLEGYLTLPGKRVYKFEYLKFNIGDKLQKNLFRDILNIAYNKKKKINLKVRYNVLNEGFDVYGAKLSNLYVDYFHNEKGATVLNVPGNLSTPDDILPK